MNKVQFVVKNGGLGRVDNNDDNVSAIVYESDPPSDWGTDYARSYRNYKDAKADGLVNNFMLLYQIETFFKQAPGAELYVVFCNKVNDPDQLSDRIFNGCGGRAKQIGLLYNDNSVLGGIATAATLLDSYYAPAVFIAADYAKNALANLIDMRQQNNPYCSVLVAGDIAAKSLADSLGLDYVPAMGHVLGATARAKVHEDTAWVEQFRFDFKTSVFLGASTWENTPLSSIELLNDHGYIFFRKFVGRSGMYLNDNHTASPIADNDFAYLNDVRVMNKAKRELYKVYLPKLNSPLSIDQQTGALDPTTIDSFELLGDNALNGMLRNGEISGFDVHVPPDQNAGATSTLEVNVEIVVQGVARNIVLNLGLKTKISS
jgi:hypothetical protein